MTRVTSSKQRCALADAADNALADAADNAAVDAAVNAADKPIHKKRNTGRAKKSLEKMSVRDGSYKPPPMVKRRIHELSSQRKLQIIGYILNTVVYDVAYANGGQKRQCLEGLEYKGFYRPPTLQHLSEYFKVSKSTLSEIWRSRHSLVAPKGKQDSERVQKTGLGPPAPAHTQHLQTSSPESFAPDKFPRNPAASPTLYPATSPPF